MQRKMIWLSAIALSVFMTSFSSAEVVELDLNFRDQGNSIGDEIERLVNLLPGDVDGFDPGSPIDFLLDNEGDVLTDLEISGGAEPSVTLSLLGISSNDTGATVVNAGISGFAINSAPGLGGGDASTALDSVLEELLTISFSSDIEITAVDFGVFDPGERFQVGDTIFENGDLNSLDVTNDLAPIFVAADTPILFAPLNTLSGTNSSIQLQDVTINVLPSSVPEPSSMLGLMGLAGLLAVKRRR